MENTDNRKRAIAGTLGAGILGAIMLGVTATGSLAALSASITNDTNTGGVGSLAMTETGPDANGDTVTCTTDAANTTQTCSAINQYGGNLAMTSSGPSSVSSTTITIGSPGTATVSAFTLAAGDCVLTNPGSTAGDLCDAATITVTQGGTTIIDAVSPSSIAGEIYEHTPPAAGGYSDIAIVFSTAGVDSTVAGQAVNQPLTWTFNA